ncbi:unnamed protein product [Brassica oleracea var. botrytis]|uniref:Uncharacterized protein n=1 Tax=Brassica oleracea TaxID=3712 RepID=A0A3P6DWS2_BRAOL|nr:unnamed protein product [Brassica oleracea]
MKMTMTILKQVHQKEGGGGQSRTNRNRRSGPTMLRAGLNQRKRLASGDVPR